MTRGLGSSTPQAPAPIQQGHAKTRVSPGACQGRSVRRIGRARQLRARMCCRVHVAAHRTMRMRRRRKQTASLMCGDRGVTSAAYAAGAGAGGMVYCVGADAAVCALEPSGGALAARWSAGNHPLACVAASPGVSMGTAPWDGCGVLHQEVTRGRGVQRNLLLFVPTRWDSAETMRGSVWALCTRQRICRLGVCGALRLRPVTALSCLREHAYQPALLV